MACVVATPTAQAFSTNITAFYDVVDTIVTTNYKNAKDNGYYLNSTLQVMSPQTASMVMYDNIPVMQNTGRLDISIPILHFEDPDFDFPIALRYDSQGFRPNEPDNYTGRDWFLECGGIIYREIKGKPDDLIRVMPEGSETTRGFLWNIKNADYDSEKVRNVALGNNPLSIMGTYPFENTVAFTDHQYQGEFSSDIYHFRFGKHSGKFMIDFDGSIIVSGNNGGKYKVDISKYYLRGNTGVYDSEIRITTDDGYIYCFGGSYGAVEYNAVSWTDVEYPHLTNNKIVGFYLHRIIAPNGRELNISYLGENILKEYHEKPSLLTIDRRYEELIRMKYNRYYTCTVYPVSYRKINWVALSLSPTTVMISDFPSDYDGLMHTLNKIALIEKITTDDKEIKFVYDDRESVLYSEAVPDFCSACGVRLLSVSMKSLLNNNIVEKTLLEYNYNNGYMFLKSIENSMSGKYSFSYNDVDGAVRGTANIDYWGYYRGQNASSQGILPKVSEWLYSNYETVYDDITYISNEREPLHNSFNESLLNRITYPTGGYSTIVYEKNNYSSYFVKNKDNGYMKQLIDGNENFAAGGARVKSVNHYTVMNNTIQLAKSRKYEYVNYPNTHMSSGILAWMPQYYHVWRSNSVDEYCLLRNSSGFNKADMIGPHISYSTVVEYEVESISDRDVPAIVSMYTDYHTHPDLYPEDSKIFQIKDTYDLNSVLPVPSLDEDYLRHNFIEPEDHSFERGRLYKQLYLAESGDTVRIVEYHYGVGQGEFGIYAAEPPITSNAITTSLFGYINKELFSPCLLTAKYIYDYFDERYVSYEDYRYDKFGRLQTYRQTSSNGDYAVIDYIYGSDQSEYSGLLTSMTKRYYTISGSARTRSSKYTYNGYGKIASVHNYSVDNLIDSVSFSIFDKYGNPIEAHTSKGETFVYIWGYKGKYPVAIIRNATIEEVAESLGIYPDIISDYGENLINDIDLLRVLLPESRVTTYVWNHLVGLQKLTDSSGQIRQFSYDESGRLLAEYLENENGWLELLKYYEYNLLND